jgi:NADPH2:quinone reductase
VTTFKAYRTFDDNGVVSSHFVNTSIDELDHGDVVVRTKYSTINYKDALSHNGTGKIMRKYPTIAGIDMAGTVEASGDARFRRATRSSCTATTWASRTTAAMPSTCACRPTGSCGAPRA